MKQILSVTLLVLLLAGCNAGNTNDANATLRNADQNSAHADAAGGTWKGSFSNGMKGAKLSFDVKNNEVKDLTFEGYWRCEGKLDLTTLGPEKGFPIKGKSVDGTIIESGFYYELHGTFNGNKASGTLRIAYTGLGCDTYKLNWTATRE